MNKMLNRDSLKRLFSNGNRPNEDNFGSLIDSMVNTVDDGITKNAQDGLALAPEGTESTSVLSFFENFQQNTPDWLIDLGTSDNPGLSISQPQTEDGSKLRLFFQKDGKTGIATATPLTDFQVKGILSSDSRMGTYLVGSVTANGQWHDILTNLNGCRAFEIVAQVGKEHAGKYAMLQAIAVSTFGKSRIRCTQAHYGFCWNKIAIRFSGNQNGYSLQMKTRSNYGDGNNIKFHICNLWDNSIANLIQ